MVGELISPSGGRQQLQELPERSGPTPLVCFVLLTWNQRLDTLECLSSVTRQSYSNYQVVLLDNASSDGTREAVQAQFPDVDYIFNDRNLGFSVAVNKGIRRALERGADFVFLLNNDTVVDEAMLDHMVQHSNDNSVGMLIPKIYYYSQPQTIWSVGAGINPWNLEQRGEARGTLDTGQWERVIERDYVTGCALMMSRQLIERIGVLDEAFFRYYDDTDMSLRARRAGYKILLVPQAKMWHKVAAASGGVQTPSERYWMAHGSVLFFRKHVRGLQWLIVVPYRFASALKTTIRLLWLRKAKAAKAYWSGLWHGLIAR